MAYGTPMDILTKTLVIQDPGTMVISGQFVWVKKDALWFEPVMEVLHTPREVAERVTFYQVKWDQPWVLY